MINSLIPGVLVVASLAHTRKFTLDCRMIDSEAPMQIAKCSSDVYVVLASLVEQKCNGWFTIMPPEATQTTAIPPPLLDHQIFEWLPR